MGRQRAVPCGSCAATWTDRRARFCGSCGAPLSASGKPARGAERQSTRGRSRWRLTAAITAGAAAVAVVVLVAATVTDLLVLPRGDPDVELPTPEVVPAGARLSPDEAADLRRQVDPDRLRCEPRGCELWRRHGHESMRVDGVGDQIVLFEERRLIALDARTGEQRWAHALDDLLPAERPAGADGPMISIIDDAVVVGLPGHVLLIGDDGSRRWITPTPSRQFWGAEVDGDRLLLYGDMDVRSSLMALDLTDGRILWDRPDTSQNHSLLDGRILIADRRRVELIDLADGRLIWAYEVAADSPTSGEYELEAWPADGAVLVVSAGTAQVAALDLVDGTPLWTRDYDRNQWPAVVGPVVGVPMPDSSDLDLVHIATNRHIATFEDAGISEWVEADGQWVVLLSPSSHSDTDGAPGTRLVGLDRDGEVAWEIPVDDVTRCCAWLSVAPDGAVAVFTDDGAEAFRQVLRVDPVTGAQLDISQDASDPSPHGRWESRDGTAVEWEPDSVTLRNGDRTARILPGGVWPVVEGPWVFSNDRGEVIGVQLMPDR